LSLPGITIGLPLWFFSTLVIPNVASALVIFTSPQEHQPHIDPSPSSLVRYSLLSPLERSSFVSSSSPSEISEVGYSVDKKKNKRRNKKKKNKKGSKPPTTVGHVVKPPVTDNCDGNLDDSKITQTTCKPKYPYRICKGFHLIKDFPGISKVIEAWYAHPHHHMSSSFEQHVDDLPSTSQDIVGKKKSIFKFPCMLCRGSHQTHLFSHMDEASKLL
jgi:hypothetical protein